jgi:hypothetical protein
MSPDVTTSAHRSTPQDGDTTGTVLLEAGCRTDLVTVTPSRLVFSVVGRLAQW